MRFSERNRDQFLYVRNEAGQRADLGALWLSPAKRWQYRSGFVITSNIPTSTEEATLACIDALIPNASWWTKRHSELALKNNRRHRESENESVLVIDPALAPSLKKNHFTFQLWEPMGESSEQGQLSLYSRARINTMRGIDAFRHATMAIGHLYSPVLNMDPIEIATQTMIHANQSLQLDLKSFVRAQSLAAELQ